jgi:hypothetical protein
METKACQNCKQEFTIEPEDFLFYEKIKVPPPTFCPECRFKARYAFRNQTALYKRTCGLCNKNIITMYAPEKSFPVYCRECFYGDAWDATQYGLDYDFSKPFFEQFNDLINKVPRIALIGVNKVNSDYSNHCTGVKNCYLCFSIGNSEDCFYMGPQCVNDKNCCSCSMTRNSEWSYMLVDCEQCYRTSFSQNSNNCIESTLLYDCRNCQNCLGCVNLRNKSFCILNEQYSKDDFLKKKKELKLNTYEGFKDFKEKFLSLKEKSIHKYAITENVQDCIGDNIINSRNCKNCFVVVGSENTKYGFICNGAKDCFDVSNTYPSSELSYYSASPIDSNRAYFSSFLYSNCYDVWYSDNCYTAHDCFGSISIRNKSHCILNKQYSPEEYLVLKEKIISHMDEMPYFGKNERVYKFGDFFPFEISPFAYNESSLQEYFPLKKEDAEKQGYNWRDSDKKSYDITISAKDLSLKYIDLNDGVLNETAECEHNGGCLHNCSTAFRILPEELHIYKSLEIPLPRICPNCRYAERFSIRNPLKLWHRTCMNHGCQNEFETSYSLDRKENVYCESCYQKEVL